MSDLDVSCPLCGGPLRADQTGAVACQVGHQFSSEQLGLAAAHRATIALWMAVSALEDQAAALRFQASTDDDPQLRQAAKQADDDVTILRRIAGLERDDHGVSSTEHRWDDA